MTWRAISARPYLKAYPEGSKKTDKEGYLALHHALYSQAETAVVKVLLASYPKAVLKRDGDRTYPLHAAVEDGAPLEVVRVGPGAGPMTLATSRDSI